MFLLNEQQPILTVILGLSFKEKLFCFFFFLFIGLFLSDKK